MIDIPENNDGCNLAEEERIDIIAQVLLRGQYVMTELNYMEHGRIKRVTCRNPETNSEKTWYETALSSQPRNDETVKEEFLFLPSVMEVSKALDMFKAKGWHAYYDSERRYYKVEKERRSFGEYADRFTRWMF